MKILHISTGYPVSFQGGITNYVRTIAEAQLKNGHDVTVLGGEDKTQFQFNYVEYSSVKIIPFGFSKMIDKKGLKYIEDVLKQGQYDIIHIHMMLDVDRNLYKVLEPYHYIVSLHDYFFICPRIQMLQPDRTLCARYDREKCSRCISGLAFNKAFMRILCKMSQLGDKKGIKISTVPPYIKQFVTEERFQCYKKLLEGADQVLPVSNRVQEIYQSSGIKANYKVLHIGNISADNYEEKFFFDWSERKIKVIMLGSVNYSKGADLFLQIAEKVDQNRVEIHFWGRSNEYGEKLTEYGVIDHGAYKQQQIKEILKEADIGLMLSVWEDNGPQVVMELLNNHVPVIGTRMGGIPDFVNSSNGYLFNPYSETEVDKMIEYINHLSLDDIYKMKQSITPTVTTKQHFDDVMKVYSDSLEKNRL